MAPQEVLPIPFPPAALGWPRNLALVKGASGRLLFLCWILPWITWDVRSGVTAAVLGHEVTSTKTKSPLAEAEGVKR